MALKIVWAAWLEWGLYEIFNSRQRRISLANIFLPSPQDESAEEYKTMNQKPSQDKQLAQDGWRVGRSLQLWSIPVERAQRGPVVYSGIRQEAQTVEKTQRTGL